MKALSVKQPWAWVAIHYALLALASFASNGCKRQSTNAPQHTPINKEPNLAGTTWEGGNEKGEIYSIAFRSEGFKITSPSYVIDGEQWWHYGGYINLLSREYPGGLQCELLDRSLVFRDVRAIVIGINFNKILGEVDKGRPVAFMPVEEMGCGGQSITAHFEFLDSEMSARAQMERDKRFIEKEEHRQIEPEVSGLGDAAFILRPNVEGCLPELYFCRRNVFIQMPETNRLRTMPNPEGEILNNAHRIDDAILHETSAVTIARVPKTFHLRAGAVR